MSTDHDVEAKEVVAVRPTVLKFRPGSPFSAAGASDPLKEVIRTSDQAG